MLDGMQELHLVQAVKETLREQLHPGHRAAIDPRRQDYDPTRAKVVMGRIVMPTAINIAEVKPSSEEVIEYIVRFMRDMPRLLDETVTANNTPDKTDA